MEELKKIVLIRKQNTPFTVNYPADGGIKKYIWNGTQGSILNEKGVPIEVVDWLRNSTTTFQDGCLIIKDSEDEDVISIKENIPDIKLVEESILTAEEVKVILTTGNHLSLQKKLKELTEGKPDNVIEAVKRQFIGIAQEIGVDSSAKRKILADWAGISYENCDLIFDKEIKEMYEKEAK
jgi:hypothetical protein